MWWAALALAIGAGCSFSPSASEAPSPDSQPVDATPDAPSEGSGSAIVPVSCLTDSSYVPRSGTSHTYKRLAGNKDFDTAADACFREGGYLVEVDDTTENQFIHDTFPGENWIGASDQETEGTFVTTNKALLQYTNWHSSEPSDAGNNEDCAKINSDASWNDVACGSETHPAVCECDPQYTPHVSPVCRTTPGSIVRESRMYFKFTDLVTWQVAHDNCAAMGATLIEISDNTENTRVQNGGDIDFDDNVWIGLHQTEATWSWDDGTPYTYKKWQGADPATNSMCAYLQTNNNWVAASCETTRLYGCECAP